MIIICQLISFLYKESEALRSLEGVNFCSQQNGVQISMFVGRWEYYSAEAFLMALLNLPRVLILIV